MTKDDLEDMYSEIENIIKYSKERIELAEQDKLKYRIKSVIRVLEYMSRQGDKLTFQEGDDLIVHCLNKLNGNIDGIELNLIREEVKND